VIKYINCLAQFLVQHNCTESRLATARTTSSDFYFTKKVSYKSFKLIFQGDTISRQFFETFIHGYES
jgi:hypothetical protein